MHQTVERRLQHTHLSLVATDVLVGSIDTRVVKIRSKMHKIVHTLIVMGLSVTFLLLKNIVTFFHL